MSETPEHWRVAHRAGDRLGFWCAGCETIHEARVHGEYAWSWNGSVDAPTLSPSVLVRGGSRGSDHVCHSFVTDGAIRFLSDCTHALAGQSVPLKPIPNPYSPDWAEVMFR